MKSNLCMKSCWEQKNDHISLMKLNNSVEHRECRDFLQAVSSVFKKAIQELNDGESQPKRFVEDSKKSHVRHSIHRGKTLKPTEEELAKTNSKQALLGWYKKCNELKVYRKKNGHCDVPRKDPKLGVVSRRIIYSVLFILYFIKSINVLTSFVIFASG